MVTIELKNIRLKGFHGIYKGEQNIGSQFEIDVKVSFEEGNSDFNDIHQTINYATVYEIVRKEMLIPTALLEKVADNIIKHIKQHYSYAKEVVISIYKLQPPITSIEGKIGITMHKRFDV